MITFNKQLVIFIVLHLMTLLAKAQQQAQPNATSTTPQLPSTPTKPLSPPQTTTRSSSSSINDNNSFDDNIWSLPASFGFDDTERRVVSHAQQQPATSPQPTKPSNQNNNNIDDDEDVDDNQDVDEFGLQIDNDPIPATRTSSSSLLPILAYGASASALPASPNSNGKLQHLSSLVAPNYVDQQPLASYNNHYNGHGKYYQYSGVPKPHAWNFGYRRGNEYHTIERHEKAYQPYFHTKVKWSDKKSNGYGVHIFDYNHDDHGKHYYEPQTTSPYHYSHSTPTSNYHALGHGKHY